MEKRNGEGEMLGQGVLVFLLAVVLSFLTQSLFILRLEEEEVNCCCCWRSVFSVRPPYVFCI